MIFTPYCVIGNVKVNTNTESPLHFLNQQCISAKFAEDSLRNYCRILELLELPFCFNVFGKGIGKVC